MRVAVIGAGITGVASAYELALAQHEVTVFERRGSVAAEGSFALPGLIAACAPLPWAVPGLRRQLLRRWLGAGACLQLGSWRALAHMPWLWHHLQADQSASRSSNQTAVQALAHASRQRLGELTQQLNLAFEQHGGGLVLLADARDPERLRRAFEQQPGLAQGMELLDAEQARGLEPGLSERWPLHGAVRLPAAVVGNGRQLAHLLKAQAQRLGVDFRFDTEVVGLVAGTPPSLSPRNGPALPFDAVVVCAGAGSPGLLRRVGLNLPLAATWGYAVTAPLSHAEGHETMGPRAAVVDGRSGIVIARLGQRVRVTGVTEFTGRADHLNASAVKTLHDHLEAAFPGCAVTREASHWKGPRLRLPDGAPVIGPSGAAGLWLNLGHGAFGWGLAYGAAQWLARQMSRPGQPVDAGALGVKRLR